jgi:hypothetical protein
LADHRLHREDARAIHGHRSGDHNADLLREQCDLPVIADAELAARRFHINPLSYEVDALRALMLANVESEYALIFDASVLAGVTILLVAIASKMYARMAY